MSGDASKWAAHDLAARDAIFAASADPAFAALSWAYATFGARVVIASSFSIEDIAVIGLAHHAAAAHGHTPRVFMLDTGRLHQETHAVADDLQRRLGFELAIFAPDAPSVERLGREHGPNPFFASPELRKACCHIRKVEPLGRALADADIWVTGLRREQAPTRRDMGFIEPDHAHGLLKLNPIIEWSEPDVLAYLARADLPAHPLHAAGFRSIGCAPCTRAIGLADDVRAGRWWWEDPNHRECGLHIRPETPTRS